jgi:hypothetical protein
MLARLLFVSDGLFYLITISNKSLLFVCLFLMDYIIVLLSVIRLAQRVRSLGYTFPNDKSEKIDVSIGKYQLALVACRTHDLAWSWLI